MFKKTLVEIDKLLKYFNAMKRDKYLSWTLCTTHKA